ncbi:alpha/beta fold hydrolase [Candidatus Formimonas warabiya]|uniref:AB hydrolase-1 domain-containing protein n=1 Tax=Formimonas warabiya TaxID=1761012 RepID=A0A3G1KRT9_FORW1|nr:alpha/beta fold hydrolase [Candidatus Formimonas warabiya]ATW25203.1 hypothetical protein DCMF_10875 [Candidatus Formimonas warabiya]
MPFVDVNGIKINYEIYGSGPRLLFLHGIGADLKNPVGAANSPLPKHFAVLAYDPRGIGESGSSGEPYRIADLAEEAAGLAKALGWEHYHVFGASMGGMIAQELAIRYPSAVERLVLCVTNAGGANSAAPVVIDKLDQMSTLETLKLSDIRQDEAWAAANPEKVKHFEEQYQAKKRAMQADPVRAQGYANQMKAVLQHDTFDRLPRITCPTLVYGGLYDGSNPPEEIRRLAGQIPGARCEFAESGHGGWYFDPTVWEKIIGFYQEK